MSPQFRYLVEASEGVSLRRIVRSNLAILTEPGMAWLAEFYQRQRLVVVGSLPCYSVENVDKQRGSGVFERSIAALKRLNALGYGTELELNLVYNPGGPSLPPPQNILEEDYRRELGSRFGIAFTRLLTITNMPLGRFRKELRRQNREEAYMRLLRESFNPETVPGLMCRRQIEVRWDGILYDCDFNLALGLPVNHGAPDHIRFFEPAELSKRRIVTGEHCFGCTAGAGSSCGGSIILKEDHSTIARAGVSA